MAVSDEQGRVWNSTWGVSWVRKVGEGTPPWEKETASGAEEVSRKTVLGLAEVCRPELAGWAKSI